MLDEPIGPLAAHYHTRGALYYILYGEATFNDAGITDDTLAQGEMRFVNSGVYYGPEEMDRSTSYVASVHEADPAGIDPAGAGDEARRCKHVNFVDNSHIVDDAGQPREAEFLFAPYSVFTVRSVAWDANGGTHRIELDAATDNTAVAVVAGSERWATPAASEDLPLAPWY